MNGDSAWFWAKEDRGSAAGAGLAFSHNGQKLRDPSSPEFLHLPVFHKGNFAVFVQIVMFV
jgi:hypothetical protein